VQVCLAPLLITLGLYLNRDKIIAREPGFKSRYGILFGECPSCPRSASLAVS
jgi:hypothetical protein